MRTSDYLQAGWCATYPMADSLNVFDVAQVDKTVAHLFQDEGVLDMQELMMFGGLVALFVSGLYVVGEPFEKPHSD